jgi:hypothetical protein
MPLHELGGAEVRDWREVADLEEDDDVVGFGEETVRFSEGGIPALQRAMTSS